MKKIIIITGIILALSGCTEPNYREDKKIVIRPIEKPMKERVMLSLNIGANFNTDKWEISIEDQKKIDEFIEAIKDYRGKLSIIGYTDTTGGIEHNQKLSLKRAESVYAYIEDRLEATGYTILVEGRGESEPLVEELTREDKRKNRRVEILFEEKSPVNYKTF